MPRYYRKKFYRRPNNAVRYRKRQRNRRFKSKYRRQTSMISRNSIAPDIAFTKLKYVYTGSATMTNLPSPSTVLANNFTNSRLIRGNDIYDPQSNASTASATGFQQWCAQTGLYQQFLVHASKIKIELVNNSTVSLSASLYPIMEGNVQIVTIDGNEQAYARTAFVGTSSGNNKVIMKNFMKTKKMIGCKDLSDDELNYGQYNSSPPASNLWDWALDVATASGATPEGTMDFKVDVTYYVQFLQRPVVSVSAQS